MIIKERSYPIRATLDEILLRRLSQNHSKRQIIEADFHREDAGHRGEQALDYYLGFLPHEQYHIFQHLRLKYENWTFQMDFLLLTTNFALIIEAKNYTGTLEFDSKFNQLIQTYNEKEKGYDDPVAQVQRQQRLLAKWFEKNISYFLPIHSLVVISNPHAILKTDSNNTAILKQVCKPFKLIDKIEKLESFYPNERIDIKALKRICKLLLKHHTPEQFNIIDYYKIPKEDILTGTQCPTCRFLPMLYKRGKWYCNKCKTSSKDAHLASLDDYFLLFEPSITNSLLKEFLHLPSSDVSQKLLFSLKLPWTGNTKGRIYHQKKVK